MNNYKWTKEQNILISKWIIIYFYKKYKNQENLSLKM